MAENNNNVLEDSLGPIPSPMDGGTSARNQFNHYCSQEIRSLVSKLKLSHKDGYLKVSAALFKLLEEVESKQKDLTEDKRKPVVVLEDCRKRAKAYVEQRNASKGAVREKIRLIGVLAKEIEEKKKKCKSARTEFDKFKGATKERQALHKSLAALEGELIDLQMKEEELLEDLKELARDEYNELMANREKEKLNSPKKKRKVEDSPEKGTKKKTKTEEEKVEIHVHITKSNTKKPKKS